LVAVMVEVVHGTVSFEPALTATAEAAIAMIEAFILIIGFEMGVS
jgi:hypothetical protein